MLKARSPLWAHQFADRTAPAIIDWPNFDEGAVHGFELAIPSNCSFWSAISPPVQPRSLPF